MSKVEQNEAAQKLKKVLKKLGVKQHFQVSQEVGCETIVLWVYEGKFQDDDNSLKIHFDDIGYVTRLTYDEDTTILNDPSEQEMVDYISGHWSKR
jgi:hypothetical protein